MTLRTKVAEALGRELERQHVVSFFMSEGRVAVTYEEGDSEIDLEALADAALATDFPVPKYEADSAPEFFGNRLGARMLAAVREAREAGWPADLIEEEVAHISRVVLEKLREAEAARPRK